MSKTLNEQILELRNEITRLQQKINNLSEYVEKGNPVPYSKVGGTQNNPQKSPIGPRSGRGSISGGKIMWNNSELNYPALNQKPQTPTKGYNKHGHSRYAGGALDKNTLEIVEYDIDWEEDNYNKHCQDFWENSPSIANTQNSDDENVEKIGNLDLVFNADTQKWGTTSYEINVEDCYFVKRDENGDIQLDSKGQEMKAPIYNSDSTKTSMVWDENGQVWRFYATFADD